MNGGKRLRGHCPHPRAQGALALSLDRERDLERQGEGKRSTQTLVSARWPTTISSIPEVPQWQYLKFLNGNTRSSSMAHLKFRHAAWFPRQRRNSFSSARARCCARLITVASSGRSGSGRLTKAVRSRRWFRIAARAAAAVGDLFAWSLRGPS